MALGSVPKKLLLLAIIWTNELSHLRKCSTVLLIILPLWRGIKMGERGKNTEQKVRQSRTLGANQPSTPHVPSFVPAWRPFSFFFLSLLLGDKRKAERWKTLVSEIVWEEKAQSTGNIHRGNNIPLEEASSLCLMRWRNGQGTGRRNVWECQWYGGWSRSKGKWGGHRGWASWQGLISPKNQNPLCFIPPL